GEGVAGVTVTLVGVGSRTTTTGAAGSYVFTGVVAGGYAVQISGFPTGITFSETTRAAAITAAAQEVVVDFQGGWVRTASISGRVQVGSAPVEGVLIRLGGDAAAETRTDASGRYAFGTLRAGGYTVTLVEPPSSGEFPLLSASVTLEVGEAGVVDFTGEPRVGTGSIAGTVRRDTTPLTGVTVTLSGTASRQVQTDGGGTYAFPELDPGAYTVTLSGLPTGVTFSSTSQGVVLASGQALTVDFTGSDGTPASVAITGLTSLQGTPLDPRDLSGVVVVQLAVDPGSETLSRVEVILDGKVAAAQGFSQASPPRGSAATPTLVSLAVNTALHDTLTGTPEWLNGPRPLRARVVAVGGASWTAELQEPPVLNNRDLLVPRVTSTREATSESGLLWRGGDVTVHAVPVLFSGLSVTRLTTRFFGVEVESSPAVFTREMLGEVTSTPTPGTNLVVTTVLSNGEPGPEGSGQVRYESVPPWETTPFQLTARVAGDTLRCCGGNWVNPDYRWAAGGPGATDRVNGIDGVGGVSITYHAGPPSLSDAELASRPAAATPGEAGLAPASTGEAATAYRVVAVLEDALGNRRIIPMEGGGVNPLGTFHVDAGVPGLQFFELFRDRTIFNGAISRPWPSPPPTVAFAVFAPPELTPPSGSGFLSFGAATRILRLDASGTACAVGAASGCVPIQASPLRELPRTVVEEGPVSEGYYVYHGQVFSLAGVPGNTVGFRYLVDETPPTVGAPSVRDAITPGGRLPFTALAQDNVDLLDAWPALEFGGLSSGPTVFPAGSPTAFGTPWTDQLTHRSTASFSIPHTLVAMETTVEGRPGGSRALVPLSAVQAVSRDVAGNIGTGRTVLARASVPAGRSFLEHPTFAGGGEVRMVDDDPDRVLVLCMNEDRPCESTHPDVIAATSQAVTIRIRRAMEAGCPGVTAATFNPFDEVWVYAAWGHASLPGGAHLQRVGVATDFGSHGCSFGVYRGSFEAIVPGSRFAGTGWRDLDMVTLHAVGVDRSTGTGLLLESFPWLWLRDN
ncbi:MAG: hypothetical protein EA421_00210, partial [Gemmatimonadales bacterium]